MMQIGIEHFGDLRPDPHTGTGLSPEQSLANTIEQIIAADQAGLGAFSLGEHHREDYSISSPSTVLAAAATVTSQITLGTAVTVLSTEDPVRLFEQFSTIDLLSGGRAELVAGRGAFVESFPLYGANLGDYNDLYDEKLALLLALNENPTLTWSGRFRAPLTDASLFPRPSENGITPGKLDIWIATGGSPQSSVRAGLLGLPVQYALIGGQPARFAPLVELYRRTAEQAGHPASRLRTATAAPGLVTRNGVDAKELLFPYYQSAMTHLGKDRGIPPLTRDQFDAHTSPAGAIIAGSPNEVADRLIALHHTLGVERHSLYMEWSGMPQKIIMEAIELLGTEVLPQVNRELATQ